MAFEIGGYQVRERIHQGRDLSAYRAVRRSDGLPLIAKIPNESRPEPAVCARLDNEFRILQAMGDAPVCVRPVALEPHGASVALFTCFCEGVTLAEHLSQLQLPLDEFLRLAIEMTAAVAAVHGAEVVHNDISPANFIVSGESGALTLIDFDIASLIPREPVEIRSAGALEGTAAYMSPEQTGRVNRSVDYRTDLYSLGATFYEMLVGAPPFVAGHRLSLIHQLIAVPPEPPSRSRPGLPQVIDDIVLRLLSKAPEHRYQSASGLLADLKTCRESLQPDGALGAFRIGASDVSSRFQIPERLYGREAEVGVILDAFSRTVADGAPVLMLVSGEPGIGKSSLVNEVHRPIVASAGYFIGGKFDQFKRNVPFASLIQALRDLIRQVLTEPDHQLRRHRERVQEALGPVGQVMVDAIPELERLIGPQEPLLELAPLESQNRFRQAFRSFLQAFARPEHPLCLLLDDVQWIDGSTLDWLEATLLDRDLGPILLICAYRDNEVDGAHPFALALERIRQAAVPSSDVRLAPLDATVVGRIAADTLLRDDALTAALTELVFAKTRGNPFFTNQLLSALHRDGAIRYSGADGGWTCDLEAIRAAEITENVVDFLTRRLRDLPEEARAILELAACVGAAFDDDMLGVVSGLAPEALTQSLLEPLAQGLIVRLGRRQGDPRIRFQFQHDRVQQAAYRLMDADEAREVRLRIGRRMLADCETPETDDRLFDILQHLNLGRALIDDDADRIALAGLNLAAARRARQATAYEPALEFVTVGLEVAPPSTPQRLRFDLVLEQAECAHLSGRDEEAEAAFEAAIEAAADDFERAEVYERKIHFYTNRARFDRAYATGLQAAGMLGIWMPTRFFPPLLIWDHINNLRTIGRRAPLDLLDLPEMQDERMRLAIRFMAAVGKAAYQIRPELCVSICARIVSLSLRHGYTEDTVIGYLAYGVIFRGGVLGDHRAGDAFGRLVLALIDRFDTQRLRAEVTFVYGYFANSWIRGLADSEQVFARAYQAGVDSGDVFHASCACSGIVQNMLMRGAGFDAILGACERFEQFLTRVDAQENLGSLRAIRQTVRNLSGQTAAPESFSDADFDEETYVTGLAGYGSPHFAHHYYVDKLLTQLLWGRNREALETSRASARLLKDSPGMQHAAEHHFLTGLLHAQLHGDAGGLAQVGHRRAVRSAARRFRTWARDFPDAYAHKQHLLEAELARMGGRLERAAQLYDRAIEGAEKAGYQQIQALAHDLAGRFHLRRGVARTARYHLTEAAAGYHRWGATALAADLTQRHGGLLSAVVLEGGGVARAREASVDLETVLKASQAIAGEIQLGEVFRQLMIIVRQNAGAQRAALLLQEDGAWFVQAEVSEDGEVDVLRRTPLDDHTRLARAIVNFVIRSGEPVILDDASADVRFRDDPYVAGVRPRSVLCAPLRYLGDVSGVIYLENNLTTGAFTEDRIEVLELLSGQIGVSIANAELYEQLEQKVRLRTTQLEARNRFISQTFGRYLSDEIVEGLLESESGSGLVGEKRRVTLIFSDLRGFTTLAEDLPPEDVVSLMNIYLGVMTEVLTAHKATIIDFVGDSIVALFGAPISHEDDASRAVACAIEMQRAMARVNSLSAEAGYPPIGMGIGLNTGDVILGSIGSETRAKYTVLGGHVNLASRIESYTVQGDVIVSQSTRDAAGPTLEIAAELRVQPKGVNEPIVISYVKGLAGSEDRQLPRAVSRVITLPRPLRVRYAEIDGKSVGGEEVEATLTHLSESEAELLGGPRPEVLTNLRVTLAGTGNEPLYAFGKVLPFGEGAHPGAFRLAFTSLPERTKVELRGVLAAADH